MRRFRVISAPMMKDATGMTQRNGERSFSSARAKTPQPTIIASATATREMPSSVKKKEMSPKRAMTVSGFLSDVTTRNADETATSTPATIGLPAKASPSEQRADTITRIADGRLLLLLGISWLEYIIYLVCIAIGESDPEAVWLAARDKITTAAKRV